MVDLPIEPPRVSSRALSYLAPVLHHAGWFILFLMLAPVIGPRGYGQYMLAFGGIAIVEALLAETGVRALVNLAVVEEQHWSVALAVMIAAGGAVWLALYAVTAAYPGDPAVHDLFRSLEMLPLLGGLAVVPRAALRRAGRQAPLFAADVAGFAAGGGIALALAWGGAGPWSLVAQVIIQRLVECLVLWSVPGERVGLGWSRRHFAELWSGLNWRALDGVWPVAARYAPCLLVGSSLGPTAAGLYMLAARLAEAVADIALADRPAKGLRAVVLHACRALLPVALASTLLAIALPPLVDLRWWGAVLPAQILLLGAVPVALGLVAAANGQGDARCWPAVQSLGGIALVALAAPYGLTAVAAVSVLWLAVVALARLWAALPVLMGSWRALLGVAVRPVIAAIAAGVVLFELAEPVGLSLAPVPALCLLVASGWLIYRVVAGEPAEQLEAFVNVPLGANFAAAKAVIPLSGRRPTHSL